MNRLSHTQGNRSPSRCSRSCLLDWTTKLRTAAHFLQHGRSPIGGDNAQTERRRFRCERFASSPRKRSKGSSGPSLGEYRTGPPFLVCGDQQRSQRHCVSECPQRDAVQRWCGLHPRCGRSTSHPEVSQSRNETVGHFRKDFFTAAFLKYPDAIRRSLSTTNTAQAVTGQLERIRRKQRRLLPIRRCPGNEARHDNHVTGKRSLIKNHRPCRGITSSA